MAYEHLRNLLTSSGKKQADLARLINKTPAVVTNLFNGDRKLDAQEAQKIAQWLGVQVSTVMGGQSFVNRVPLIGEVGAGGEVYSFNDLPLIPRAMDDAERDLINCEWVEPPPGAYPDGIVAVRVKGESMMPFMPPGTIVYYAERFDGGAPDHLLSSLCVVQTADERALLKIVNKGQALGTFNLQSYNMVTIADVKLAWCAPVVFIKPFLKGIMSKRSCPRANTA